LLCQPAITGVTIRNKRRVFLTKLTTCQPGKNKNKTVVAAKKSPGVVYRGFDQGIYAKLN